MTFWSVFTTRTGKEKDAAAELRLHGFAAFVPLLPKKVRNGSRYWRPPAVPGYVLIEAETMTRLMLHFIMAAEFHTGEKCVHAQVPGKVTAEEMLEFLEYLEGLKEDTSVKQSVEAGDKGLLHGRIPATVASVKGEKLNLLIAMFNSTRVVTVEAGAFTTEKEPANDSNSLHKTANHCTTLRRDWGP